MRICESEFIFLCGDLKLYEGCVLIEGDVEVNWGVFIFSLGLLFGFLIFFLFEFIFIIFFSVFLFFI